MGGLKKSQVDKWLKPDGLMLLECWARDYKMADIAHKIGIGPSTLSVWKKQYPEIDEAVSKGKEIIDYKVENALLKSALGYTAKEIKVTIGKQVRNGKTFMLTKETTTKEMAPNVTACAMWLNNRLPDKWKKNRDKVELEEEDSNLTITIARGPKKQDADEDNINNEVQITSNNKSTKEHSISNDDKDYWPEDWSDEDE